MEKFKKAKAILYVEDEKSVQTELSEIIESFCEMLYVADNGAEGLELFKKHSPCLVVSDIKMPIMNGLEMAKAIKVINPETQVLFTTAFSEAEYMQEAIAMHIDGYILKPIDLEILESKIIKIIKIVQLQKELEEKRKKEKRKKAELETILSITKDGIVLLDLSLNFLYANEAYQQIMGYSLEELQNENCVSLTSDDNKEKTLAVFKKITLGQTIENYQKKCRKKDGSFVTLMLSSNLMPDGHSILVSIRDVSDEVHSKHLLDEYLKLVDENIITSTTDLKGVITYASKAFCEISGYSKEELIGSSHNIVRCSSTPQEVYAQIWLKLKKGETWEGEIKNRKKDGTSYWVFSKIYPVYDENGERVGYTAIRQDISNMKKIEEISITDGLTGVFNRRHFNDILPKFINSAKRNDELISFAMLDIDFFKHYNDTYGHQKGDEVLIAVAQAIGALLHRSDDYFFRLGGEEFGLLFKTTSQENSLHFAKSVLATVQELKIEHSKSNVSEFVSASLGLFTQKASSIEDEDSLYKITDDLLYEAKQSGRNRVAFNEDEV